jgi:hypothetical protein
MLERTRLELKQWREEYAAEERADKERQERPIRELEAKINNTQRELLRIERARLTGLIEDSELRAKLKGKAFLDPDVFVDERTYKYYPETLTDPEFARDFNAASINIYRERNPHIYWSSELVQRLGDYFDRHDLALTSVPMIEAAVDRILAVGLAPKAPPPPPTPEPSMFQQPIREPAKPKEPEFQEGWDVETGQRRMFSRYEISRMSGDEYARTFRLNRAAMLLAM